MKKHIILTLILLSLFSFVAHAQLKLGITGGLNISQLTVSDEEYEMYIDKIRPGFLVGPTAILSIPNSGLSFDVSALFDWRAARSKNNDDCNSVYCTSFQFPVSVRYGFEFGDMVYGFISTGPQFGVNTGEKERLIIAGRGRTTGHAMERRWVNESSSLSWNIGIGAVVMEKVQVRISYNFALHKTAEIQQIDLVDGSSRSLTDAKANACQVAISYLF